MIYSWNGREGKKKRKEKAASGSEFLFLNCRRLLNFFCFLFLLSFSPSLPPTAPTPPPRHPSPISLQVPSPPPPAPPLPLLRLFLPSSGQLLQLQHFCNPSFPHNSRETHTHTLTHSHIPTPSPAAAARRLAAVVFVEEGKKEKQTPSSSCGNKLLLLLLENKKLLHLLPCGSNRVLVPAAVAISLFLSLRLSHNCRSFCCRTAQLVLEWRRSKSSTCCFVHIRIHR